MEQHPPEPIEEARIVEPPHQHDEVRSHGERPEPGPIDAGKRDDRVIPRYTFGNPFAYTLARGLAFTLDIVLVTAVVTSFIYGMLAINPLTGLPAPDEGRFDSALGIAFGVALLYGIFAEALTGTTIGKLAFGLHVYAARGGFVGFGRAFVRALVRVIDFFAVGAIFALLPGHRRLGDLLGGTVVARSPLRAFSPLLGWILIIVVAGVPVVVIGIDHLLATFAGAAQYVPPLAAHAWHSALSLAGAPAPTAVPTPLATPTPLVTPLVTPTPLLSPVPEATAVI